LNHSQKLFGAHWDDVALFVRSHPMLVEMSCSLKLRGTTAFVKPLIIAEKFCSLSLDVDGEDIDHPLVKASASQLRQLTVQDFRYTKYYKNDPRSEDWPCFIHPETNAPIFPELRSLHIKLNGSQYQGTGMDLDIPSLGDFFRACFKGCPRLETLTISLPPGCAFYYTLVCKSFSSILIYLHIKQYRRPNWRSRFKSLTPGQNRSSFSDSAARLKTMRWLV
jgi:hypothetical protein